MQVALYVKKGTINAHLAAAVRSQGMSLEESRAERVVVATGVTLKD